jgi:hypothetical protein
MRYLGNSKQNFSNAVGSQDMALTKDIILDRIIFILDNEKYKLKQALEDSGVNADGNRKELIKKISYNLYNNEKFRTNIGKLVSTYSNQDGGKVNPQWITEGIKAVGNIFGKAIESRGDKKTEEEKTRQALLEKAREEQKNKRIIVVSIIGGVILIGSIVAYRIMRKK